MDFKIGKTQFSENKVVIIAEAGVNHLGKLEYAERLIKSAAKAGADIIKFQTYKADKLTTKNAKRFWDWNGEKNKDGSQFDSYSELDSFGLEEYIKLKKMCDKYKIEFLSTPFDEESVEILLKVGVKGFKIASCDITNFPLIEYISKKKLPVLLSTGASNINEIKAAVKIITKYTKKLSVMHCTLCYPTSYDDSNLLAIQTIKKHFPNYVVGLSDHSLGTIIAASSVLLGARVIEKHFTIDKTLPKSADHWLSLDPDELKKLVDDVKILKGSIGSGLKECLKCEIIAKKNARRSIVLSKDMLKGEVLKKEFLILKRPGIGLPSNMIYKLIGKKLKQNLKADTLLNLKHIK